MNALKLAFGMVFCLLSTSLSAQDSYIYHPNAHAGQSADGAKPVGGVKVISEPYIDSLLVEHKRINEEEGVLSGYRIQIASSSNLSGIKAMRSEFMNKFPDLAVNIVLESPNFKLRAGNYMDRFEAFHDLQLIVTDFKGAFIVKDLIDIADL